MGFFKRSRGVVAHETSEIAHNMATSGAPPASKAGSVGALSTALASAVALIFSAISLYHSVLKQPELGVHVSSVVHYTRDANGNFEVFAIPLTIANHGARDGTVLDIDLTVSREGGEETKAFFSAYSVDGSFFVPPGRYDSKQRRFERVDRPKQPFAPIAVPGRDSFSGTLLFYKKGKGFPKIVTEAGNYRLKLKLNTRLDKSLGAVDQLLAPKPVAPIEMVVRLPYYSESEVLKGGTHRMTNAAWSPAEEQNTPAENKAQ